ncbi:MAG: sigma-54-dependent transcriptional regulator [Bacteroidota bacterium]
MAKQLKILIVDDDPTFGLMLETFLNKHQYETTLVGNSEEALRKIRNVFFDVLLLDLRLPGKDGLEMLKSVKQVSPESQVVMMTAYADIQSAVQSIKLGAYDYVSKPVNPEEILQIISEALSDRQSTGVGPSSDGQAFEKQYVKGQSDQAKRLNEYIQLVAPTNMSVLISGESGTGKEYIARSVHAHSKRKHKPFVAVDCGALPKELALSELFGHVKGSFTGAVNDKKGHFEAANKGTLFLDEVGNLSYEIQVQLLRALQENQVKPVGSNNPVDIDVRVITATNEDLSEAVRQGNFREDLYHRLNEFDIKVPRLADCQDDIMNFASHFLKQANEELAKNVSYLDEEVVNCFLNYDWPGNLREMRNVIRKATLLAGSDHITTGELPVEIIQNPGTSKQFKNIKQEYEYKLIVQTLRETNYNKSEAARKLSITRKTLYNKIKFYDIDLPTP